MKLTAYCQGLEHHVALTVTDTRVDVQIDDRKYELELRRQSSGGYLLLDESRVYSCRVETVPGSRDRFKVIVRGRDIEVVVVDPKRLRAAEVSAHHHGSADIIAPMPGKVVRVLVKQGNEVSAGAGVIVVEAMKMQNELKSPRAGVVTSINVEVGATVNAGDVLAVVEE